MPILSYSTKIQFECQDDKDQLREMLEAERTVFNFCSEIQFVEKFHYIKPLHDKCYQKAKQLIPGIKVQIIIKAQQAVLSAYASIRSNKHKITGPAVKKRLSITLDKRLCSVNWPHIRITTLGDRISVTPHIYPKLQELISKYKFGDLKLFERDGEFWISFPFKVPNVKVGKKLAIGIDLGVRRFAATSEGQIFIDRRFNKAKRRLRYLKRRLKAKRTKSSNRHLKKLRHTERHRNKELVHQLANKLLKTKANILVLEDLDCAKLKKKKHAYQNKSHISQVGLGELRRILTYKAGLVGKRVVLVNPAYTSQTDSVTGLRKGKRQGTRFYSASGLIYDADINAANNLTRLAKHPASHNNLLCGQADVIQPIVGDAVFNR